MTERPIVAIVGPTASGKTRRAVEVARRFGGEIISGDSRQVYRGMTIGTGKDLEEYGEVPYHLVDIEPAGVKYNLFGFLRDAAGALEGIRSREALPVVCGGTGMYVEAFLNGVSLPQVPENPQLRKSLSGKSLEELTAILASMKALHNTTDVDTAQRAIRAIEIQTYYEAHPEAQQLTTPLRPRRAVVVGVDIPRDDRRRRISERLQARLDQGMVDEVRSLLSAGIKADDLIYYGLEYKWVTQYAIGEITYQEMFAGLETAIHQFAKRQMTWFRGMERRGWPIHWLRYDMPTEDFTGEVGRLLDAYVDK